MLTVAETQVLVVDDDCDTRGVVTSAISMMGMRSLEAGCGAEAVELYLKNAPALVIMDVMMPGETGIEVCRKIKALKQGEHTPVLMLTARDGVKEKVEALDGGADDYITKPFHYQELQARVRALLRVRELNIALRDKNAELLEMQDKLIQKERQMLLLELAGTTAHRLGQPLCAILLNCHLLETLSQDNPAYIKALQAVKSDARLMSDILEKLRTADAKKKEDYYERTRILDIDGE